MTREGLKVKAYSLYGLDTLVKLPGQAMLYGAKLAVNQVLPIEPVLERKRQKDSQAMARRKNTIKNLEAFLATQTISCPVQEEPKNPEQSGVEAEDSYVGPALPDTELVPV